MNVQITFHGEDYGPERTLRQIALGLQPLVLIEPSLDEETNEDGLQVQASEIDLDQLEAVFEVALAAVRQALSRSEEDSDA